ncbi:MAG: NAD(+) diphosphatase [Kangiellaceae bacterium]|nr:NAD(+) diphosphatase [Kangiellaceae bacterium]
MLTKSTLNRRGEVRQDQARVDQWFESPACQILISFKGRFICNDDIPAYFLYSQLSDWGYNEDSIERIYLGEDQQTHYFVVQLKSLNQALEAMQLIDLRTAALSSQLFDIGSLFYSQGLINWHFSHGYCAKCGSLSQASQAGHSRTCTNPDCGKEHFPRIEPAVIFSVQTTIDGVDKILLARQPNWPEKRYSVLAGFAEHGESLELTVEREAMEEVGLVVSNVEYISSQPWPFPASLMLGFTCETKQHEISLIDQELEHAQWLSAKEIKTQVAAGELLMPFSVSISWHLVDRWYIQQTGQSIKTLSSNEKSN